MSNYAENNLQSKWGFYFRGDNGVHNRYIFERCKFFGYVSQSSGRSNRFMAISELSSSSTCSVSFYFCNWGTNSGNGNNSALVEDGKIWIFFEEMGSSNVNVIYNIGAGEVGGHTCKKFQVRTKIHNASEILHDNSSDFSNWINLGDGTLTIRNILAS